MTASSSSTQQHSVAAANSVLLQQTEQSTTTPAALVAAENLATTKTATQHHQNGLQQQPSSARETRSSKKRKVWLSPCSDTPTSNVTPASPGGIPQVDGADSVPKTPDRCVTPPFKDPPTPPPMSPFFPTDPNRVICHLCLKNVHFLMYEQCEFCHYRMKFAYKKL